MPGQDIYVTQPYLPPLAEFIPYLEKIWASGFVTNNAAMHQLLERELAWYLGVDNITLFNNGTTALLAALQTLGQRGGEVITTPFSFVATAHSILWQGLTPVFVDIDPDTLNLDARRIEAAITPQTVAILPVHCYGYPCDTTAIQAIATRHGLPVIYDAAHAFGVQDAGGSILRHGDMSVLSFHATKVFSTLEGGAVISRSAQHKQALERLRNFGIVSETELSGCGINGKMSEVHAAFGLLQLQKIEVMRARRRAIHDVYTAQLHGIPGLRRPACGTLTTLNHAYYPVLVGPDYPEDRDALYLRLKSAGIHARRYFYPLISNFPLYQGMPSARPDKLPVANAAARQVLCLPVHAAMTVEDAWRVVHVVREVAYVSSLQDSIHL